MNYRIELAPLRCWRGARGEGVKQQIKDFLKTTIDAVWTRDVYTISADITAGEVQKVAEALVNPVLQKLRVGEGPAITQEEAGCKAIVVIGFKPGVTDNVGRTAQAAIGDIIGRKLRNDEQVFSSVEYLLYGDNVTEELARKVGRDRQQDSADSNRWSRQSST